MMLRMLLRILLSRLGPKTKMVFQVALKDQRAF
ncbi:hypothetical protein Goshw_017522 [Gossypium schwendimanii]|uniref:Uncharacterized protein n=1 Tax=Gossypium schwendimanii TaxID=34291 RepID=A0A7J9LPE1_GOSSC|nr:hypothetical protein [Gossypium schwendimanii]